MSLQKIGVKGRASVRIIRNGVELEYVDDNKRLKSGEFVDNLVLDAFFAYLAGTLSPSTTAIIKVGTGSIEPSPEQTQLVNWVNPVGGNVSGVFSGSFVESAGVLTYSAQYVATFPLGAIVANLSEAGLIYGATSPNALVHTRLLFKDGLGNPTTITVTAEDQLIITYIMDYVMDIESAAYVVNGLIDDVPTDISIVGQLNSYANITINRLFLMPGDPTATSGTVNLGIRNTVPSEPPSQIAFYDSVTVSYLQRLNVSGGKECDYTMATGVGNLSGGISSLRSGSTNLAAYRWNFTPAFPKDANKQFKFTFRREWSRL